LFVIDIGVLLEVDAFHAYTAGGVENCRVINFFGFFSELVWHKIDQFPAHESHFFQTLECWSSGLAHDQVDECDLVFSRFPNSEWHSVDVYEDRAFEAHLDGGLIPFVELEH